MTADKDILLVNLSGGVRVKDGVVTLVCKSIGDLSGQGHYLKDTTARSQTTAVALGPLHNPAYPAYPACSLGPRRYSTSIGPRSISLFPSLLAEEVTAS